MEKGLTLAEAQMAAATKVMLGAGIAGATRDSALVEATRTALTTIDKLLLWLNEMRSDRAGLEAGARRFGLALGRGLALALMVEQAQWSLEHEHDGRARAAALYFARLPVDMPADTDRDQSYALANDESLMVERPGPT